MFEERPDILSICTKPEYLSHFDTLSKSHLPTRTTFHSFPTDLSILNQKDCPYRSSWSRNKCTLVYGHGMASTPQVFSCRFKSLYRESPDLKSCLGSQEGGELFSPLFPLRSLGLRSLNAPFCNVLSFVSMSSHQVWKDVLTLGFHTFYFINRNRDSLVVVLSRNTVLV